MIKPPATTILYCRQSKSVYSGTKPKSALVCPESKLTDRLWLLPPVLLALLYVLLADILSADSARPVSLALSSPPGTYGALSRNPNFLELKARASSVLARLSLFEPPESNAPAKL